MDSQNTSGAGAAPPMDTSNLKTSIIAAWVVMTVLAFVTVCMRFYTRRLILHIIGVEDWLILIAMVCSCPAFADPSPRLLLTLSSSRFCPLQHARALSVVSAETRCPTRVLSSPRTETFFGTGQHIWTVTPEMIMQWKLVCPRSLRIDTNFSNTALTQLFVRAQEQFYSLLFYIMSLAFAKVSIIFLYMRVMTHGVQRIATYVLLGIIVACNIWAVISQFVQCIPIEANWNPAVQGTCLGLVVGKVNSILHIVTDFFIFLLPIPTLLKLKINMKQKIGLVGVFSLGFL